MVFFGLGFAWVLVAALVAWGFSRFKRATND